MDYKELKDIQTLDGSLNIVVSQIYHLRRPPSLSESCAWDPENIARALKPLQHVMLPQSLPTHSIMYQEPEINVNESHFLNMVLKFLFHITLISIFESVFFFAYVSQLEDAGLQTTVGGFIDDATNACRNFTPDMIAMINSVLEKYINASRVIADGNIEYIYRQQQNTVVYIRSWIYVGGIGSLFMLCALYGCLRKRTIKWKVLFFENIILVLMLAAYEYMFFSTIITPYQPISGSEIASNAIQTLQDQCRLLT